MRFVLGFTAFWNSFLLGTSLADGHGMTALFNLAIVIICGVLYLESEER